MASTLGARVEGGGGGLMSRTGTDLRVDFGLQRVDVWRLNVALIKKLT